MKRNNPILVKKMYFVFAIGLMGVSIRDVSLQAVGLESPAVCVADRGVDQGSVDQVSCLANSAWEAILQGNQPEGPDTLIRKAYLLLDSDKNVSQENDNKVGNYSALIQRDASIVGLFTQLTAEQKAYVADVIADRITVVAKDQSLDMAYKMADLQKLHAILNLFKLGNVAPIDGNNYSLSFSNKYPEGYDGARLERLVNELNAAFDERYQMFNGSAKRVLGQLKKSLNAKYRALKNHKVEKEDIEGVLRVLNVVMATMVALLNIVAR